MNRAELPPADLDAARLLLARLGVTPDQLLQPATGAATMPTIADYLNRVAEAVSPGTLRAYSPYWNRVISEWGSRRLNEPGALEVRQLAERTRGQALVRRNARGGRLAAEHMIAALRCMYRFAEADGLITERDNPARKVAKPRRLASARHALHDDQLQQIITVVTTTGNDTELDALLLRLHTETACRRGGALQLRPHDLDTEQCLIRLREKGDTERWQPISPTLTRAMVRHHHERGPADTSGPLLRYRNGRPITRRRYDYLWTRVGRNLPWAATLGVSTHWLRHTTLTWVERNFGYAVARAYAGHNERNDAGTTATYVRANVYEVALALARLTGEPHPLAPETLRT